MESIPNKKFDAKPVSNDMPLWSIVPVPAPAGALAQAPVPIPAAQATPTSTPRQLNGNTSHPTSHSAPPQHTPVPASGPPEPIAPTSPATSTNPPAPTPIAAVQPDESALVTSSQNTATTAPPVPAETIVIAKEQEEFEGTVDVNDDVPTEKDLYNVGDLVVLDEHGESRPFKELYNAPLIAPRQLIIFIRHFFCGNCQEYLRALSTSIKPDDLLALPIPSFITVVGCGRPELIPMYRDTTACPFPIYADPTRKIYDLLGMTRTWQMGAKPEYMERSSMIVNSVTSIFQGLGSGRNALKGGDMKQVGGEFLFEDGECTWVHRMKTTRDHAEVKELREQLGLGEEVVAPVVGRKEAGDAKNVIDPWKANKRSMSWGKLKSKAKDVKDRGKGDSRKASSEIIEEEEPKKSIVVPAA